MYRTVTLSIACAAACVVAGPILAQEKGVKAKLASADASQSPPTQLASYGRNYASATTAGYQQPPHAMAFGRTWGGSASNRDSSRFYHYPYVFYPQNFRGDEYYRSSNSMYYRYPAEMQIPVYNRHWHNYYPSSRRYHWGHHFILDVF